MKRRIPCESLGPTRVTGVLVLFLTSTTPSIAQLYPTAKLDVPRSADDIELYEFLGLHVSVTEDTAWLAEPNDDLIVGNEGAVFGFERTKEGWVLAHDLQPSDAHASQAFSTGMAFNDSWALIGSPKHSLERLNSGAIYFFRRSGASWLEVERVHQPDPERLENLGTRVALSGKRAIASCTGDDEAGEDKGAAYVYVRSKGKWSLEEKLVPSHPSPNWWGGASRSLDIDGDVAVLGAVGGGPVLFQGIVFVFERTPSGWTQTAVLEDPTPKDDDQFGYAVAVQGDTILVGEPVMKYFHGGYRPGSVLVFERMGPPPGGWAFVQELQASNKSVNQDTGDHFGYSLDVHEDRFLAGALYGKIGNEVLGSAYLFERGLNGWEEVAMLAHDHPFPSNFGVSVALSSSFALVGAHSAEGSVPGIASGAAYVYELPYGEPYCAAAPNSTGAPATIHATGSLVASAEALELWAESLPADKTGLFLVSRAAGFVQNPGGSQGNLCLGGPIGRLKASVQSSGPRGRLHHVVDTGAGPPNPPSVIQPGETWCFQAWYRDQNPADTSNFTPGLEVAFQ